MTILDEWMTGCTDYWLGCHILLSVWDRCRLIGGKVRMP
jgi:hypothetical protein